MSIWLRPCGAESRKQYSIPWEKAPLLRAQRGKNVKKRLKPLKINAVNVSDQEKRKREKRKIQFKMDKIRPKKL